MMFVKLNRTLQVGCALLLFGSLCLAQEPARETQRPERQRPGTEGQFDQADPTAQLWQQISQLHRQIVALESQHATRGGTLGARQPQERPTGASAQDLQRREGEQPQRREGEQPRRGEAEQQAAGGQTEQLWMQIARLHKQIVQMEAGQFGQRTPVAAVSTTADATNPLAQRPDTGQRPLSQALLPGLLVRRTSLGPTGLLSKVLA